MTRQAQQNKIAKLAITFPRLVLEWCTGVGKSKAILEIVKGLLQENSLKSFIGQRRPFTILLLVGETAHKKNWKDEWEKWGGLDIWNKYVLVSTYASLKHYANERYDILILDEGHHAASDLRLNYLSTISADRVYVLSATLSEFALRSLTEIFGKFVVSSINLKEAIKQQILKEPEVILIPLQLDNRIPDQIVVVNKGKSKNKKKITCTYEDRWIYLKKKEEVELTITCTKLQKYLHLSEQMDFWRGRFFLTRQEYLKTKWMLLGAERKRFLGECKTEVAKTLLTSLGDKRILCFCASIDQAMTLGGERAIHSFNPYSEEVLEKFNKKQINSLFAVGMIQEGQNLTDVEAGIIIQLGGQEREFIQKFGRSLRAEKPVQYVLYYKNTRDEEYLENVTEGVESQYIITKSIESLTNTKE